MIHSTYFPKPQILIRYSSFSLCYKVSKDFFPVFKNWFLRSYTFVSLDVAWMAVAYAALYPISLNWVETWTPQLLHVFVWSFFSSHSLDIYMLVIFVSYPGLLRQNSLSYALLCSLSLYLKSSSLYLLSLGWSLINLPLISFLCLSPLPLLLPRTLCLNAALFLSCTAVFWPQGGSRRHREGDQWPTPSSWHGYCVFQVRQCVWVCVGTFVCVCLFIHVC